MGIYGAGKAFNLRYAQNTYVPNRGINTRQTRQPIMFGSHCHCAPQSTNVTINNGPTGFWGFMSGLFGGLSGGGMFGGMGMGGFNPLGGMFNLFGGSMSPFGALNAQQAQNPLTGNQDKLANLKTRYPNHNIVSDGNDKYSATDKDGHLIGQGLSYEDMCKVLSKAKPEEKVKVKVDDNDDNNDDNKIKDDNHQGKVNDSNVNDNNDKFGTVATADDFGKYNGAFTVHDEERGAIGDINRDSFKVSSEKDKSGFPNIITVGGYQYSFQGVDSDGAALYKSQSGKGDIYRLEKNPDGKFALNQYSGMEGAGTIDISTNKSSEKPKTSTISADQQLTTTGNTTLSDGTTITKNKNGDVTVRIPLPLKDAGEVTLKDETIKNKTAQEIRDLAAEQIKKNQQPRPNPAVNKTVPNPAVNKAVPDPAAHPANNGKTHIGSRQPWL